MALDLYAGSLTRYYTGRWENVAQAYCKQQGLNYHRVPAQRESWLSSVLSLFRGRATLETQHQPSDEEVLRAVLNWRDQLAAQFADVAFDWAESAESPFFTERPDHETQYGLFVWASQTEHPTLARRRTIGLDPSRSEAFRASMADGFQSADSHLLRPELWIPCDFATPFRTTTLNGSEAWVGSSLRLAEQLAALNRLTWNQSVDELESSIKKEEVDKKIVEPFAKMGFIHYQRAANWSVEHKLPLLLDY